MSKKEERVNEISKKKRKKAELQVIKLSPLGYCNFMRDVLILGGKEA